ncbi:hypothetical protein QQF64_005336 [Cirrhinus molitorella]|uniref:Uncharacterized protein n=2 Tax=Cirrhinus molitorella TaxID=172907 RepID=A0ABR3MBZ1_9TELE|nr:hypothetical protein Q8A67_011522 [Cirrhinus molitorella]
MLYIVGIVLGLIVIIQCMSNGLSQIHAKVGNAFQEKNILYINKWRMNNQELHLIIKLLSVGLVDADPNTLHHIKEYRDLGGSST